MGHWAEDGLPELKGRLGIGDDSHDAELRQVARDAQEQIERLAGRRFGVARSGPIAFKLNGLPFVELHDLNMGSPFEADIPCWPVPDPANPEYASVLQVNTPVRLAVTAGTLARALGVASQLVVPGVTQNAFTAETYWWLKHQRDQGHLEEVLRSAMDPTVEVQVPIVGVLVDGWWLQISRRLVLVTKETPDDGRLAEVLIPFDRGGALVATEPLLIIARLTEQPVKWAIKVRLWIVDGTGPTLAWRVPRAAAAIHRYGIPTVSLDALSTVEEARAQLLLAAHWHGYLRGEEHEIPSALVDAFPREVARIRAQTGDPDSQAAAVRIFERLYRKGFDPSCSAETVRHYVRRHASTIVREHRTLQRTAQPWERLDISKSYYYKYLRKLDVPKSPDGRFAADGAVADRIRHELELRARARETRADAHALLRERGFGYAAARKRFQRDPTSVLSARPRRRVT